MSKNNLQVFRAFFLLLTGGLLAFQAWPQRQISSKPISISVDAGEVRQRVDGFGSSFGGFAAFERGHFDEVVPEGVAYKMNPELRKKLVRIAVGELGVSHLRLWIGRGVEETNDNDDPATMAWNAFTWEGDSRKPQTRNFRDNRRNGIAEWPEFLKQAIPLGLQYWIPTPGSMPEWLQKMFESDHPNRYEEYAEWAAAQLLYLKKMTGYEAPYWSMFNEPDVKNWKSSAMWIPWIQATGRRFRKEGLSTKIMFPDNAGVFDAVDMTAAVMQDAEARQYIGALAYHHYRSSGKSPQPWLDLAAKTPPTADLEHKLLSGIRGMATLATKFGLPSWQTESAYYPQFTKTVSPWDVGMGRANEVHYEIANGAAAVEAMSLFAPDALDTRYDATIRYEGHHILLRTDGERVSLWAATPDTAGVLAQWSRFVRPGDYRIEGASNDPLVNVTAFASEKNERYVAVMINNSSEPRDATLKLSNAKWQSQEVAAYLTDATHIVGSNPAARQGNSDLVALPLMPKSVTSVIWSVKPLQRAGFQISGLVPGAFPNHVFDQKRFVETRSRERSGEALSREDNDWMEWANAWREEMNENLRANNPPRESTGMTPLTELSGRRYKGHDGGLYAVGQNRPPAAHAEAGITQMQQVRPRDKNGDPSADGSVVLLSVGMSNTTMEFQIFRRLADADPQKNPHLVIVDGAQGGHSAELTADPQNNFWKVVDQRLTVAGVTPKQVQVAWLKQVTPMPWRSFPGEAKHLQGLLRKTMQVMMERFPNLRITFLSSRIYGGYAETALHPEPYAYETAFAVKWLIADQIAGDPQLNYRPEKDPVRAPWLAWGPYLWADGMRARGDGVTYTRADLLFDGIHPSQTGQQKVARQLLEFFKTDAMAHPWFVTRQREKSAASGEGK